MAGPLDGKVAIVTGGNSGIGEATVHRLAREGARVAILARREKEGLTVQGAIRDAGGDATFIRCDVMERPSIEAAVAGTVERYGALHILVNNAGGAFPTPLDQVADENWDKTIRLNLTGTFIMCQTAWPHLVTAGGGSIVNITTAGTVMSIAEEQSALLPPGGLSGVLAYISAKAGIEALTRFLAKDGAQHGIRVNAIRPGRILTPKMINPTTGVDPAAGFFSHGQLIHGPGQPEDVANAIFFLASDESRFMNAQVLNVDGGLVYKV
jgi:NAD(P)-dependent dehydrogenase (short-subunit alcohol dehydrogenase family)